MKCLYDGISPQLRSLSDSFAPLYMVTGLHWWEYDIPKGAGSSGMIGRGTPQEVCQVSLHTSVAVRL